MKSKKKNIKRSSGKVSIKLIAILTVVLIVIIGATVYFARPLDSSPQVGQPQEVSNKTMLELINDVRAEAGKPAVTLDATASKAAKDKADDQVRRNYWGHNINGEDTFQFLRKNFNGHLYPAGENLAKCQASDQQSVEDWVKSPGHYAVMTGEYTKMGYAETRNPADDNCLYTVMYFLRY